MSEARRVRRESDRRARVQRARRAQRAAQERLGRGPYPLRFLPLTGRQLLYFVGAFALVFMLAFPLVGPTSRPSPEEATAPPVPAPKTYSAPPPMAINPDKTYTATIETEKGNIQLELFPKEAPKTVNNFAFLARQGFYDGLTFHRVISGFMAQGGDPKGDGTGGPGYTFEDESNSLQFDKAGVLAMANSGPNTNGSQFFITYAPQPHLNGKHTIFGQVVGGMDVLSSLTPRDPTQNPAFPGDAIKKITINSDSGDYGRETPTQAPTVYASPSPTMPPPATSTPSPEVTFKELATYRKAATTWKNIVVSPGIDQASLIKLAKEIHKKDAGSSYHIFDDDSQFKKFMDWDVNYPNPAYPFPEAWANEHHIANIQQMFEGGRMKWGLYNPYGIKLADLE